LATTTTLEYGAPSGHLFGTGNVRIGNYINSATSRLSIYASTSTISAFRIEAGVAVTSPVPGDFWNNGSEIHVESGLQVKSLEGTGDRLVEDDSSGTLSATRVIVDGWISDTTTMTLLSDTANWGGTPPGQYVGPTLSNTYQGQEFYDDYYFYKFVADELPIRMPRV
jgi:hypothetical protein